MQRKIAGFVIALTFALLISGTALAATPLAPDQTKDAPAQDVSRLPDSLTWIGEGAFEGTALENVELPDSLTAVGDEAFADIPTLKTITVPASVQSFGRDVLAGSERAIVIAPPDSEAAHWASVNRYRLLPSVVRAENTRPTAVRPGVNAARHDDAGYADGKDTWPSARQNGEVKAEACVGCHSLKVTTRYFP